MHRVIVAQLLLNGVLMVYAEPWYSPGWAILGPHDW